MCLSAGTSNLRSRGKICEKIYVVAGFVQCEGTKHKKFLFDKPYHGKSFFFNSPCEKDNHWGDHPQSEGEEEDGSFPLQEEGRHPLPPWLVIYFVGFW